MRVRFTMSSEERSLKKVFLGFGNVVAAIVEGFEDIEAGAEPIRAMKKTYRKARRRWTAMEKADKKSASPPKRFVRREREEPKERDSGVVIDVTPEVEKRRSSR
jgi:hypothetical protein